MAPRTPALTDQALDQYLEEVTGCITALAGHATEKRTDDSDVGRVRGVTVPMQRKAFRAGYSFSSLTGRTRLAIWDHIWRKSDLMEVMHQALYAYEHKVLERYEVSTIRTWIDRCMCWEHSDDLSKIYADVVERNPQWMLPSLKRWNRSRNPWKRRQSVVALIEYAGKRKHFPPFELLIEQVEALLEDEDYYVQKGVGWTIREIGHAYPEQVSDFLERNAARLSPQAWTGATKNMDPAVKAKLKSLRRK